MDPWKKSKINMLMCCVGKQARTHARPYDSRTRRLLRLLCEHRVRVICVYIDYACTLSCRIDICGSHSSASTSWRQLSFFSYRCWEPGNCAHNWKNVSSDSCQQAAVPYQNIVLSVVLACCHCRLPSSSAFRYGGSDSCNLIHVLLTCYFRADRATEADARSVFVHFVRCKFRG